MASVVITLKVMPDSPDVDFVNLQKQVEEKIKEYGGEVGKVEITPIAFGLKALVFYFVADEAKGSTEPLENSIAEISEVNSVEITDVRRAVG